VERRRREVAAEQAVQLVAGQVLAAAQVVNGFIFSTVGTFLIPNLSSL